jgi:hypothetical protein
MSYEHDHGDKSICDFCNSEKIRWAYPADDFEAGTIIAVAPNGESFEQPIGSKGPWAACEECSQLIERGDYSALKARAIVTNINAGVEPELSRILISGLHGGFRAHRTGPRQEIA